MFDGLLPEPFNAIVLQLIFLCAHWHGLAKLRLHTDLTLGIMDRLTTELGQAFLEFERKVCQAFETRELPREMAARQKRHQAKAARNMESQDHSTQPAELTPLFKALNLNKYKHHALGDYVSAIRRYGTTDSYSSQTVGGLYLITRVCPNIS